MPPRRFTDEQEIELGKLYLSGVSTREIARRLNLPGKDSILGALRRRGIEQRSPSERNRLYSLNPNVFDIINNEHVAYWWGYLWADGYVHRRSLIVSTKDKDCEIAENIKVFMESNSPTKHYIHKIGEKSYPTCFIEFTDQHLVDSLKLLGVTTGRPSIIPILMYLPDNLTNHWIRGYFDGDGSATKSRCISFCGDRKLLNWIREVASDKCGTNPGLSVHKHRTANLHYLSFSWKNPSLSLVEFMYNGATIWLKRKRERIDEWVK